MNDISICLNMPWAIDMGVIVIQKSQNTFLFTLILNVFCPPRIVAPSYINDANWLPILCCSDVQQQMDTLCSGLQSCRIAVHHSVGIIDPCSSELRSYLQARYTCIPGKNKLQVFASIAK